jgi:hypothetical protein
LYNLSYIIESIGRRMLEPINPVNWVLLLKKLKTDSEGIKSVDYIGGSPQKLTKTNR